MMTHFKNKLTTERMRKEIEFEVFSRFQKEENFRKIQMKLILWETQFLWQTPQIIFKADRRAAGQM